MSDEILTQAEIDALLNKSSQLSEEESSEPLAEMALEAESQTATTEQEVSELEQSHELQEENQELLEEKVLVKKPLFEQLRPEEETLKPARNLDLILDVPLEFSVVLGKTKKTIREILALGSNSVVELEKLADENLEIYVNGKLIAEGEVVIINENFGIRITNILSRKERVQNLK
ncbi:MAG: flagellar motor switch protein FliN [Bacteroidales bacterium]|jgi:flagellar motor switch protein FliN/FliY|nr:flagellar motor switch protein FliN [Bacteroidales bacterium]